MSLRPEPASRIVAMFLPRDIDNPDHRRDRADRNRIASECRGIWRSPRQDNHASAGSGQEFRIQPKVPRGDFGIFSCSRRGASGITLNAPEGRGAAGTSRLADGAFAALDVPERHLGIVRPQAAGLSSRPWDRRSLVHAPAVEAARVGHAHHHPFGRFLGISSQQRVPNWCRA